MITFPLLKGFGQVSGCAWFHINIWNSFTILATALKLKRLTSTSIHARVQLFLLVKIHLTGTHGLRKSEPKKPRATLLKNVSSKSLYFCESLPKSTRRSVKGVHYLICHYYHKYTLCCFITITIIIINYYYHYYIIIYIYYIYIYIIVLLSSFSSASPPSPKKNMFQTHHLTPTTTAEQHPPPRGRCRHVPGRVRCTRHRDP